VQGFQVKASRDGTAQPRAPYNVAMILSCPACNTRYQIDDAALAEPAGRELACAKCGHRWRYVPAPIVAEPGPEPPEAEPPRPVPGLRDRAPTPEPAALLLPPAPARPRRSGTWIGWLVLILVIAGAVVGLVLARNSIVALWPAAGSVYRAVGLSSEPPAAGLEIVKVAPTRNGDALVVEGDVTNKAGGSRTLPRLRIALRDAGGKELTSKVIDPPVPTLGPGAMAHFRTLFEQPSDAATGVAVTFTGK
jgi:predicted Zn finger-like uncharacterized protein